LQWLQDPSEINGDNLNSIYLRIPTIFWIGGRTTFLSYWMCIMLVMLGR
jgi:hypothetical protein